MSTAAVDTPPAGSRLQKYTLEELVKEANRHGQLLFNAGEAVLGVEASQPGIFDGAGDPDLFMFIRGRASRASAWYREIGNAGTMDPPTAECWKELTTTDLDLRLPALTVVAHVAYLDPGGHEDNASGDIACMGWQPWEVAAYWARDLGQVLKEWAAKHGQDADTA